MPWCRDDLDGEGDAAKSDAGLAPVAAAVVSPSSHGLIGPLIGEEAESRPAREQPAPRCFGR